MKLLISIFVLALATPALLQYAPFDQRQQQQQPQPYYDRTPRPIHLISKQFRSQDILGNYRFGFESTDGVRKEEVRNLDGNVAGGYFYTSPEGEKIQISYQSGKSGFSASGNAIPQPIPLPEANVRAIQSHFKALEEARLRAPEEEYDEQGNPIRRGGIPAPRQPYRPPQPQDFL